MKMFKIALSVLTVVFLSGCMQDIPTLPEGTTEEDWKNQVMTMWHDDDGDGFGDATPYAETRDMKWEPGWSPDPSDCDDTNPLINPNGTEVRDLVDNDCNEGPDEHWIYMFVVTGTTGNISPDGLGLQGPDMLPGQGIDGLCNSMKGDLPGTYNTWTSSHWMNIDPEYRFDKSLNEPYVLQDGTKVADNWADLTDGTLDHAINQTVDGTIYEGFIWSGTPANGDVTADNSLIQCNRWRESVSSKVGLVGHTGYTDSRWTDYGMTMSCDNSLAIICVRQKNW